MKQNANVSAKTYHLIYNKFQTSLCNCLRNTFTVTSISSRPMATNPIVNETACQTNTSGLQRLINIHFNTVHYLTQLSQRTCNMLQISCIISTQTYRLHYLQSSARATHRKHRQQKTKKSELVKIITIWGYSQNYGQGQGFQLTSKFLDAYDQFAEMTNQPAPLHFGGVKYPATEKTHRRVYCPYTGKAKKLAYIHIDIQ